MPAARSEPMAAVVVLYNHPRDVAAFERYYNEIHVPLVGRHLNTLDVKRVELVRFTSAADGSPPNLHRKAELWFESEAALKRATATPAFKEVADDIPKFASGGFSALISVDTPPVGA